MASAGKDRPRGPESRATVERLEGRQLLTATLDTGHGGEAGTEAGLLPTTVGEAAMTLEILPAGPTMLLGNVGSAEGFALPSADEILLPLTTELPRTTGPKLSPSSDSVMFDEP